jgi:hypothetical protein
VIGNNSTNNGAMEQYLTDDGNGSIGAYSSTAGSCEIRYDPFGTIKSSACSGYLGSLYYQSNRRDPPPVLALGVYLVVDRARATGHRHRGSVGQMVFAALLGFLVGVALIVVEGKRTSRRTPNATLGLSSPQCLGLVWTFGAR